MNKDLFLERFRRATTAARDFARTLIEDPLPDEVRCRVNLNASYDGNPLREDESVFPEDTSVPRRLELASITVDEAADLLWRNGKVPEWINVSVTTATRRNTIVEIDSCGRFTDNDELLYHIREERPPFHVLGPAQPLHYVEGTRFSIFFRSSCSNADEFELVNKHRASAWSLELIGPHFDDEHLSTFGQFPPLEILELKISPLQGPGLSGFSQMPKLRILRLHRYPVGRLSLSALPLLPKLEQLDVEGLSELPELGRLEVATPALSRLSLAFASTTRPIDIPRIDALAIVLIRAKHLSHPIRFPEANKVNNISIRGNHSDREVLSILDQLPSLDSVYLRRTNVTDEVVRFLSRYHKLSYVDLVGTNVSHDALESLRAEHPKASILPRASKDKTQ